MKEDVLWFLVGLLTMLVIFLGVGVALAITYLLRQRNRLLASEEPRPKVASPSKAEFKIIDEAQYCHNHPNDKAIAECAICHFHFCEDCTSRHEGLLFCKEHMMVYLDQEWIEILELKLNHKDQRKDKIRLFKIDLWKNQKLPTVLTTHYKINIESDEAEAYLKYYVREQDAENLRPKAAQWSQE